MQHHPLNSTTMSSQYVPYSAGVEKLIDNEAQVISDIIASMQRLSEMK